MKNIAPDICRQRLMIEGYFQTDIDKESLKDFLLGLAKHLNLRTYGDPVIFQPNSGMGKDDNAGFDAFVPLIDSGISAYIWAKPKFLSVVIYTCKAFDEKAAIEFTTEYFNLKDNHVHMSF